MKDPDRWAHRIFPPDGRPIPAWRLLLAEVLDLGMPPDSSAIRWLGGWLAPLALSFMARPYFFGKALRLYGRDGRYMPGGPMAITGGGAVAAGVALAALALFLHFQCFWPRRNEWVCATGKLLALGMAVGATGRIVWELFSQLAG